MHGHVAAADNCDQALRHKEVGQDWWIALGGSAAIRVSQINFHQVLQKLIRKEDMTPRGCRARDCLIDLLICRHFCASPSGLAKSHVMLLLYFLCYLVRTAESCSYCSWYNIKCRYRRASKLHQNSEQPPGASDEEKIVVRPNPKTLNLRLQTYTGDLSTLDRSVSRFPIALHEVHAESRFW